MSTTVIELENKDIIVKMSGKGPIGPRGRQGEPGPAGPSEWGVIQGNISDQTDLQNALDAKADVGASYTKSEEDALLAQKANADSVYTKTETDALLADKADTDDVYSKADVNTLLSGKADADTVYTKTETDTLLDAKADVGDSYTKAEEDALLAVKANSADVYTKTETDTLLADKADADDVYTKTEVDDALADKADSADVYTKTETDTLLLDKAPVIRSSASGSIASFTDGSASPVTALSVSIEPVQEGTGDPSPDNVRPISGHTSAVVTRTGKNLCEGVYYGNIDDNTGQEIVGNNGVTGYIKTDNKPIVVSGMSNNTNYNLRIYEYNSAKTYLSTYVVTVGTLTSVKFTPTANASYIRLKASSSKLVPNSNVQIELDSSASAFEPYQGTSITIDLDGTRYGGTLNVLTGEMTVDMAMATFDGSDDEGWLYNSGANGIFYKSIADMKIGFYMNGFCNWMPLTNAASVFGIRIGASDNSIYCYQVTTTLPSINNLSAWKTYLASNNLQIVYPLATPLTVQLTPSQLSTLLGTNNIWADTGDVAVEYRADSKMYIDQSLQSQSNALKLMLTPNVETEMVASQNYALGSIVIVNNDFLKLTSAVASGANLVIGSNCVKTTMAEWVASLTA